MSKTGNLEDFGCHDGNFTIVTPHMIQFWNPWDHVSTKEVLSGILVFIRMTRKVNNVKKLGIWSILGVLMGFFLLQPHI